MFWNASNVFVAVNAGDLSQHRRRRAAEVVEVVPFDTVAALWSPEGAAYCHRCGRRLCEPALATCPTVSNAEPTSCQSQHEHDSKHSSLSKRRACYLQLTLKGGNWRTENQAKGVSDPTWKIVTGFCLCLFLSVVFISLFSFLTVFRLPVSVLCFPLLFKCLVISSCSCPFFSCFFSSCYFCLFHCRCVVDLWYRDGHCARLLRLPDIPCCMVGVR